VPRSAALFLFLLLTGLALVLLRWPVSPSASLQHGCVSDDNGPVAGARVRFKGNAASTLTDAEGRFQLFAPPGARRLTAWKEGYFIAGARRDSGPVLHLTALPQADHDGYEWVDPAPSPADEQRCGNCHPHLYREWATGGHARSATGKHFRNLYDGSDWHGSPAAGWSLLEEHPDGAGVCSSCHAPTVRDNDPALFDLRKVGGVDALGVHCDYCHKIAGLGEGQIGLSHGRFLHRLKRPEHGQLFFGPLDDVDRGEDSYSPFYRDSRYCAACHEGVVFGVAVYTTYSEWLKSPAARAGLHCQHCHLKPTRKLTNIAKGHGGIERDPRTLANHVFWDGSQVQMLRRCLQLQVTLGHQGKGAEALVSLRATHVGHRVPTGFIDRQLILVVEGFSAAGHPVGLRRGPTLPAAVGRELAGKPGKLYARLLKDQAGRGPVPFWRAFSAPEDTRLAPGQVDEQCFTFASDVEDLRVQVRHRRFWAEVAQTKHWPDRDQVVIDRIVTSGVPGRKGSVR
jgi:hypothetical protein